MSNDASDELPRDYVIAWPIYILFAYHKDNLLTIEDSKTGLTTLPVFTEEIHGLKFAEDAKLIRPSLRTLSHPAMAREVLGPMLKHIARTGIPVAWAAIDIPFGVQPCNYFSRLPIDRLLEGIPELDAGAGPYAP